MNPLITVITPTTGAECVRQALDSVKNQTYKNIQHLVVVDGDHPKANPILQEYTSIDLIKLPYATGKDQYNGHRIYGAMTYLAKGDFLCFLDEDNWYEENHIETLVDVLRKGNDWAYSFRKVFDKNGKFLLLDNCEALGEAYSAWNIENHHFVDWCMWGMRTECLKAISGVLSNKGYGIDRTFYATAKQIFPKFVGTNLHTFCFRLGGNEYSVKKEFFEMGNKEILKRFNGKLPWILI